MKTLTKPRKVAIGAGAGLGLAGVAFAAVLLSAPIAGTLGVQDANSRLAVRESLIIATNGGMSCGTAATSSNGIIVDATARRVNGNIGEQSCTLSVRVTNEGVVPISNVAIEKDGTSDAASAGWKFTPDPTNPQTIAAGTTTNLRMVISAGGTDVTQVGTGKFTGKVSGTAE